MCVNDMCMCSHTFNQILMDIYIYQLMCKCNRFYWFLLLLFFPPSNCNTFQYVSSRCSFWFVYNVYCDMPILGEIPERTDLKYTWIVAGSIHVSATPLLELSNVTSETVHVLLTVSNQGKVHWQVSDSYNRPIGHKCSRMIKKIWHLLDIGLK